MVGERKEFYENGSIKSEITKKTAYTKYHEEAYAFDFTSRQDKHNYISKAILAYYKWNQEAKFDLIMRKDVKSLIYSDKKDKDRALLPSVLMPPPYSDYGVDTLMLEMESQNGILKKFCFIGIDDWGDDVDYDKDDISELREDEDLCCSVVVLSTLSNIVKGEIDYSSVKNKIDRELFVQMNSYSDPDDSIDDLSLYYSYFSGKQAEYNEDGSIQSIQMYGDTGEFLYVEYYDNDKVVEKYIGKDGMLRKVG